MRCTLSSLRAQIAFSQENTQQIVTSSDASSILAPSSDALGYE